MGTRLSSEAGPPSLQLLLCTGAPVDLNLTTGPGAPPWGGSGLECLHLCRPCHNREKAKGLGKYICQRCHLVIDEQPLMFRSDAYHPDHFNCTHCGKELTAEARELKGELYCLPCHDKMGVPICGACRRPIEGRVVNALGKQWHVEHFVCAKCEKPFLGHRHYEKKGLAYCETHYNQVSWCRAFGDVGWRDGQEGCCEQGRLRAAPLELCQPGSRAWEMPERGCVGRPGWRHDGPGWGVTAGSRSDSLLGPQLFGDVCYNCSHVIEGDVVSALNKAWCVSCFSCSTCNSRLTLKNKFVEFDMKPVCKRCYEKFPLELKKRLKKLSELTSRKAQPKAADLSSA
ncbi:LIM and senescent cell antigen-like-containing domain protein 2 [Plecturocebus cupreus]